jgi:hypothetical protein
VNPLLLGAIVLVAGGLGIFLWSFRPKPTALNPNYRASGNLNTLEGQLESLLAQLFVAFAAMPSQIVAVYDFNESIITRFWRKWQATTASQAHSENIARAAEMMNVIKTSLAPHMDPRTFKAQVKASYLQWAVYNAGLGSDRQEQILRGFNARTQMVGEKFQLTQLEIETLVEEAKQKRDNVKNVRTVATSTANRTAAEMDFESSVFRERTKKPND